MDKHYLVYAESLQVTPIHVNASNEREAIEKAMLGKNEPRDVDPREARVIRISRME
jgi:hypothetical protein